MEHDVKALNSPDNSIASAWARPQPLKYILLFALLFFAGLQLPSWPVTDHHDAGGQAAIAYWTQHHYQYGKEIVQNVGPLGFVNYPKLYTGFLDGEKLVANIVLTALFTLLVIILSRRIAFKPARWIMLAAVGLFSATWLQDPSYMNADVRLYLLMLLIAYVLLSGDNAWIAAALAFVMAFLSLAKGTLMHIAPVIVAVVFMNYLLRRKPLPAAAAPCAYALAIALFWWFCGQDFSNLPAFLSATLGLKSGYASGYNDSMFIFESGAMRLLGIGTMLLAVCAIALKCFHALRPQNLSGYVARLSVALIELFILFVVWKHGFVRADGHMMAFFSFTLIACTFFLCLPGLPKAVHAGIVSLVLWAALLAISAGGIVMCLVGNEYQPQSAYCPGAIGYCPEGLRNLLVLLDAPEYSSQLHREFDKSVAAMQMPAVQQKTGHQGVGYFGFLPAVMLYNNFDYRPMPNTISFTGWSHESMQDDAAFFRDDAIAPPWLLYKQGTIDGRISGQDDALAQLEILKRYDPVLSNEILVETRDKILLRRRQASEGIEHLPLGTLKTAALGEWVDVPTGKDPVWMKLRISDSVFSTLLKTLYKPSQYNIEYVLSGGKQETRKFMARMAEDGFMVAPYIDNNKQFIGVTIGSEYDNYLSDKNEYMHRITKFRLVCAHLEMTCADRFDVTFEALHGLELGRIRNVSLGQ